MTLKELENQATILIARDYGERAAKTLNFTDHGQGLTLTTLRGSFTHHNDDHNDEGNKELLLLDASAIETIRMRVWRIDRSYGFRTITKDKES